MNPTTLLIEAGIALARFLWHKAHGEASMPDENAIKAAGLKAAQMAAQAASLELQRRAALLGIREATAELDRAAHALMYEMGRLETDPSPDIPNILEGADVQQMPESWEPEDEGK